MVLKSWSASHVKPKVLVRWRCQDGRSGEDWHSSRLVVSGLYPVFLLPMRFIPGRSGRCCINIGRVQNFGSGAPNQLIVLLQTFNIRERQAPTNTSTSSVALEAGVWVLPIESMPVCVHEKSLKHPRKLLKRPVSLVKYF